VREHNEKEAYLQDNNLVSLELTETELKEVEKAVAVIEEDICVTGNCKPDNVKDPDYITVKSWLEEGDIKAMLGTQYTYDDRNASLVMLGIAMHVMSDAYAHQARVVQDDGTLKKPAVNDDVNDGTKRYYYAKEACLNLWSNYYNNVKTTGADFDGNGKKFKLKKLYTYSLESRNGKSKSWYLFDILKEYSCGD